MIARKLLYSVLLFCGVAIVGAAVMVEQQEGYVVVDVDNSITIFSNLINWMESSGAMIDKRQQLNEHDVLCASELIPAGTILASIPYHSTKLVIYSSSGDSLCDLIQAVQDEFQQGESSIYEPYLNWLQTRYLRDSSSSHEQSLLSFLPDTWSKAGQNLLQSILGDYLPPQNIGGHVRWYQSACRNDSSGMTTALDMDIALLTIQQRSAISLLLDNQQQEVLMPWLDLYAHDRSKNNVQLQQESGDIILFASSDIPANAPLFMDYGVDTPTLLVDYGMVESDDSMPHIFEFELLYDNKQWHYFHFEIGKRRQFNAMPTVWWPEGRPESRAAFQALQDELDRLERVGKERLDSRLEHEGIPEHEFQIIQKYYNVLSEALRVALQDAPPDLSYYSLSDTFELYNDFDISSHVRGSEGWWEMLGYRKNLMNPSISFYEDKVALKRWLPTYHKVSIPPLIALFYASELPCDAIQSEYYKSILRLLPSDNVTDFVAKPSHKAESYDLWIVNHNGTQHDDSVLVSLSGRPYKEYRNQNIHHDVAKSLADSLYERPDDWESWALLHVKPGIVIEERIHSFDRGARCENSEEPSAMEFKVFVIWGKAWVAQWYCSCWVKFWRPQYLWDPGYVRRDGTMVHGSWEASIPEWVDWTRIVEIAERVGAHKDMLRIDILVGVPTGSMREGMTRQELIDSVRYMVSELEFFPSTAMHRSLMSEGARLWREGYMSGNVKTVPNVEIPDAWRQRYGIDEKT